MNEGYNRRKMPDVRENEKQNHRYAHGKGLSEAPVGMPMLRGQVEHS